MRLSKPRPIGIASLALLVAVCALCAHDRAEAELRWPSVKKENVRLRLVALAWNHPRSSFFASEEVFVAEKQLGKDESRLVKLVYGFLPYQPRLSDAGLDYANVFELRAARDPSCDETLLQMTTGEIGDWRQSEAGLKYSTDAPELNLQRRKSTLPCYVTSAEDYSRSAHHPTRETGPVLTRR